MKNPLYPLRIAGYALAKELSNLRMSFYVLNKKMGFLHLPPFSGLTGGCQSCYLLELQKVAVLLWPFEVMEILPPVLFNINIFFFICKVRRDVVKSRREVYQHQNTENYFLIVGWML